MQITGNSAMADRLQDLQSWLAPLGSFPWIAAAILIALSCAWAFGGRRGFKFISHFQGALFGLCAGALCGAVIEHVIAGGSFDVRDLLLTHDTLRAGSGFLAGLLAGGLLGGFAGRFLSRFFFFAAGAVAGGGLLSLLLRLLGQPLRQPLPLIVLSGLLAGVAVLWISYRQLVPFTGIWGGLTAAAGLVWPMLRLFVIIGGPPWLPLLAAGGLGILLAIAGTAWQADRQDVGPHSIHSVRR